MDEINVKGIDIQHNDDEDINVYQIEDQQFLVIRDSTNIDVLDENLYCYNSDVFSLTPAIQNELRRACSVKSDNLLTQFLQRKNRENIYKEKLNIFQGLTYFP